MSQIEITKGVGGLNNHAAKRGAVQSLSGQSMNVQKSASRLPSKFLRKLRNSLSRHDAVSLLRQR